MCYSKAVTGAANSAEPCHLTGMYGQLVFVQSLCASAEAADVISQVTSVSSMLLIRTFSVLLVCFSVL